MFDGAALKTSTVNKCSTIELTWSIIRTMAVTVIMAMLLAALLLENPLLHHCMLLCYWQTSVAFVIQQILLDT